MCAVQESHRWGRDARAAVRSTGFACLALAVLWLTHPWGVGVLAIVLAAVMMFYVLRWRRAVSLDRMTSQVNGWRSGRRLRRTWHQVSESCGLTRDDIAPRILRIRSNWPYLVVRVSPLMGQTVEHFESSAEPLRTAVGFSRLRIEAAGIRDVRLIFTMGDQLRQAFAATVGEETVDLGSVRLGLQEDGNPWRLVLGPHTLVAGSSGAGKGSVFWSFAFGLAPAVRTGLVQLHGIDLKGGMEVLMGGDLFTTTATNALEAVVVLEDLVDQMRERSARYAGHRRDHEATEAEPLHVVMIDELAALTAYSNERELQRRSETAINLLCSQGRAPGFMVFACLQDPRKEVIPSRGLFTQMVGLRLKDVSETIMVLGDVAALSGAHCHRITRDVPGTGFVLPEDGGHPIRVRAGFASDEAIREVAHRFAAPVQRELDTSALMEDLVPRRRQRVQQGVTSDEV